MPRKDSETIDSKLKTAWHLISRMFNAEAAVHGGNISMAHFLLNIDSNEGSFASDIAPMLGMEGTSLSRMIVSLEEKKLIQRIPDKKDKRRCKILLTLKGKKHKELAKAIVINFNLQVEKKVGKEQINTFYKTIEKITEVAEERSKLIKH
ncbi:MAG: transcriptional regulator, MarR family [Bacteroidetes bacterium]|nr:transcriptional regulator, MarR family [Bacteroidota bacterium]